MIKKIKKKLEKGYYIDYRTHSYGDLKDFLSYEDHIKYDTYEEAEKYCYPDDFDTLYTIYYTDGNDNWYLCSMCGHDSYRNNILLNRLKEGNQSLWKGYYIFNTEYNFSNYYPNFPNDAFICEKDGVVFWDFCRSVYDNLEDSFNAINDTNKYKVCYIDEDKNINEISYKDVMQLKMGER